MIAALIVGGYLVIGLMVGLVAAYKIRLEQSLAGAKPDWDDAGVVAFGLTLFWLPAAVIWCIAQLVVFIGRGIDTAVDAEVEERHARDRDADP